MSDIILNSFESILIICKIFGTLSTPLNDVKRIYQNIYTLFVASIFFAMIFYTVFFILGPPHGELAVLYATDWIQVISSFFISSVLYYQSLIGRGKLLKVFKSLSNVDEIFVEIEIDFDYKNISQNLIIQILLTFTAILLSGLAIFFMLPFSTLDNLCRLLISIILIICVHLNSILFSNIVYVIYLKYKAINKYLININNEYTSVSVIFKITNCYDEVNEILMMVNKLFGLTNLVSIGELN